MKICITYTQKQVAVHVCGFDGIRRGNYFGGEPIGRAESGNLKNGKAAAKDEIAGDVISGVKVSGLGVCMCVCVCVCV